MTENCHNFQIFQCLLYPLASVFNQFNLLQNDA